jgi:hypothetical protein
VRILTLAPLFFSLLSRETQPDLEWPGSRTPEQTVRLLRERYRKRNSASDLGNLLVGDVPRLATAESCTKSWYNVLRINVMGHQVLR